MNTIMALRKQYGLTQQQLADYLSVSKGLISLVEKGKRQFPLHTLVKLAQLQQPLPTEMAMAKKLEAVAQKQQLATDKALQREELDCSFQLAAAIQELHQVKEKYAQATNLLQLVAHMLPTIPKGDKKTKLWLEALEAGALQQATRYGERAQVLLQLKIEGLQQKALLISDWQAGKKKGAL
jgi:transcriptional regulator with XRE-family HTH domain